MKNYKTLITGLLLGSSIILSLSSCDKSRKLSAEEITDLNYLREEEKLARDVYLFSYDLYQDEVFLNISKAEQKHMDKILKLLENYDLTDPASTQRGVFNNTELQTLYNQLIDQSDSSLIEALKVGATIEDVDLFDIRAFVNRAERKDILNTFEKLDCGSENHMRAFSGRLTELNYQYVPQYISQIEYDVILASESGGCGNN